MIEIRIFSCKIFEQVDNDRVKVLNAYVQQFCLRFATVLVILSFQPVCHAITWGKKTENPAARLLSIIRCDNLLPNVFR